MRILAILAFFLFANGTRAATPTEEIESLLAYLGGQSDASFIRNGSAYPASAAVAHLRLKWRNQQDKVHTAEDFIRLCGTGSSMTGERYRIRAADGTERFCDEILTEQLAKLRAKAKAAAPPNGSSVPAH